MRQSILAILLIGLMILGGCKAPTKPSVAAPGERVEETEQEQAQSVILPAEPQKEEPVVPQPEPQPEAQPPAEEEKKNPELTFVKFWEKVPEMSVDEANAILREKINHPNERLTDEERMAIYVAMMNLYTAEGWKGIPNFYGHAVDNEDFRIYGLIAFEPEFRDQIVNYEAFSDQIARENQPFAGELNATLDGTRQNYNNPQTTPTETFRIMFNKEGKIPKDPFQRAYMEYESEKVVIFSFMPSKNGEWGNFGDEDVYRLYRDMLRFYLSMEQIEMFVINEGTRGRLD